MSGGIIVACVAIICGTIISAMRVRHGGVRNKDKAHYEEETRIIQQLHDDLSKMEARIEALETILMESTGKDKP